MKLSDIRNFELQRAGSSPLGVKLVIASILFVFIVAIGWFWKINPKRDELRQHEAKEIDLLAEFETKQGKVVNLEAYEAQLASMKDLLDEMVQQLPSKTQMPELLVEVSQKALSAGIDVQKFEPGAENAKEFYVEKPIAVKMVGTYHQFGLFVSGVAGLERVVVLTSDDISLKPVEKPGARTAASEVDPAGLLVLEGTVKTYRYIEEGEAVEAAGTKTPETKGGSR
ncbi:MAG TPA: type 4a pilus biogenesis protein PilO [Candidatus Saccharimonadia bacterium]|nr:type 4a pilus biogenesis protein PilO [Candidatus Saccharimonadia bacterium]